MDRTLPVAAVGTFLSLMLFTLPMCALSTLAGALHAGPAGQTWMLSSMSVGLAAGLLIAGALADDYGRRRVFVAGAVVVVVTSVVGVVTTSALVFVLARIGQGIGAAALVSCSLGLIGHAFPTGHHRVRATGIWGASVGAGIAFGPPFAALLDDALGWRSPYLIGALLTAVLAVVAQRSLAESRSDHPHRVDLPGALLLGAGTGSFLAGLVTGREGWTRPATVVLIAAGVLLLVAFVLVERRGKAPLLDLKLFRRPDFVAVTSAALTTGLGVIAAMSFVPVVLGKGLGQSALIASLAIVIWSGISVPVALAARRLHWNPDVQLAAGLLVITLGLVLLTDIHVGDGIGRLAPGLAIAGLGSGVLNAALGRQAVASVPTGRAAMGSGANNTARYLGSAIGVTVVAVLATSPTAAGLIAGWNTAVLVTAAFSLAGVAAVALCLSRQRQQSAAVPSPAG
jgi:MFS family permease